MTGKGTPSQPGQVRSAVGRCRDSVRALPEDERHADCSQRHLSAQRHCCFLPTLAVPRSHPHRLITIHRRSTDRRACRQRRGAPATPSLGPGSRLARRVRGLTLQDAVGPVPPPDQPDLLRHLLLSGLLEESGQVDCRASSPPEQPLLASPPLGPQRRRPAHSGVEIVP